MEKLSELFGSMVFNETVMRERLPQETFNTLKKTMDQGIPLEEGVANIVANAMKDWAVEKGATNFTPWVQPMTGITAEKHDSFISPQKNGTVIMNFSGKELVKGEPDGSSFPSGGIRATCEARGYTAWDPTSPAFIKDGSLCIPTAFCSYGGEALDKKTPLLRSMDAIDRQSKRILALFGKTVKRVSTTVGPEQEYFLIDADLYRQREDLKLTGRTLFGAPASKGQELDDHYFGVIRTRVSEFMKDLDKALWELGIPAKTKHNEVAPAQHELAPIFSTTNIAADHNQLTMELMKKIAKKHNLVCLLHEKPFAGVNGSGKHNNWSLTTDTGENLLEPGKTPEANAQFLLILTAVIKGVDEYQDLLRASVATAGNDHRLGANEAPPAIISMFVGDELEALLESIQKGVPYDSKDKEVLRLGVDALPDLPKDNTDRNRTSPFAFTGNKFEFRSLGSSLSISCPNIMLNTIIAEEFRQFADILEFSQDFNADLNKLIKTTLHQHSRIIFNGNGYSPEWVEEAKQRGLLNLKTTTDAMPTFLEKKNVQLFEQHGVYTEKEMKARYEIQMEEYTKTLLIEARTMITMVYRQIGPAVLSYTKSVNETIEGIQKTNSTFSTTSMTRLVQRLAENYDMLMDTTQVLEEIVQKVGKLNDVTEQAIHCTCNVIPTMEKLRTYADTLETITAKESWPFPVYSDLLFYE